MEAGQVIALVGGSGSGKTTMLRQIVGLLRPTEGEVRLFGEPLFAGGRLEQAAPAAPRHAVPARRAILGFQRFTRTLPFPCARSAR